MRPLPDDDSRYDEAWVENGRLLVRLYAGHPEYVVEIAKVGDLVRKYREDLEDVMGHMMCQLDLEDPDDAG